MNSTLQKLSQQFSLPVLLLLAYAALTTIFSFVYLPSPFAIWDAMVSWVSASWSTDIIPSIRNLILGFGLGSLMGAAGGLILGMNTWLREIFEPIATFIRSIPPIALIPIFMLAMGIDDSMRIAVIATGAFFPVLVNAIDGVSGLETTLKDVIRTHQIKTFYTVKDIILPGALPQILAGMKTALTISIILIFTSELRGATDGIGAFILQSERFFAIPALWAGTIFLGLLGFLTSRIFDATEERLLAWRS